MQNEKRILFLSGLQNGFVDKTLLPSQGGQLYVPGGERAIEPAVQLIEKAKQTIFFLSQFFYPLDHIIFSASQKPQPSSAYVFVKEGPLKGEFAPVPPCTPGSFRQKLYPWHCRAGSQSALFPVPLMEALPKILRAKLKHNNQSSFLYEADSRGNEFYIVRLGTRKMLDPVTLTTERDGQTGTVARFLFRELAKELAGAGTKRALCLTGGLATKDNWDFSRSDIDRFLAEPLRERHIEAEVVPLPALRFGFPRAVSFLAAHT